MWISISIFMKNKFLFSIFLLSLFIIGAVFTNNAFAMGVVKDEVASTSTEVIPAAPIVEDADLTNYNAAINKVSESDYTTASWGEYQKVVSENPVTEKNTQAEVDSATAKVLAAQDLLDKITVEAVASSTEVVAGGEKKVKEDAPGIFGAQSKMLGVMALSFSPFGIKIPSIFNELEAPINELKGLLNSVKESNFTISTWSKYQSVVSSVKIETLTSKAKVEVAIKNIIAAQKNLVHVSKIDELDSLRKIAQSLIAANAKESDTPNDHITGSLATLKLALENAIATNQDAQDIVDAKAKMLKDAIADYNKAIVPVANLVTYFQTLNAVKESDYTTASWTAYKLVVAENIVINLDTLSKIETSIKNIQNAQKNLVRVSDLTALNLAKQAAQNLISANAKESDTPKDHVVGSLTKLQTALSLAIATNQDPQDLVNTQTSDLNAAITTYNSSIVPDSNLAAYNAALLAVKSSDYTIASWAVYQSVVTANVVSFANTQAEVDAATKNIVDAKINLIAVSDITALDSAKARIMILIKIGAPESDIPSEHIVGSLAKLEDALSLATSTNQDTQLTVDNQVIALNKAIEDYNASIVAPSDISAYITAIEAVKSSDYTTASWATYQSLVLENQATTTDSQTKVNNATSNILAAQKNLIKIPAPKNISGSVIGGGSIIGTNINVGKIQSQIAQLREQMKTIQSTSGEVLGASTFTFTRNLRLGSRGDDVVELQSRLRTEGFFTFATNTGYFGQATLKAVKAYQKAHGIIDTGIVGKLTLAELNK